MNAEAVGRSAASGRFGVLSVCVGNICRSPVSERLLDHLLGDLVEATGAGTHAVVGAGIHPAMAARLSAAGVSPSGTARQLTVAMVSQADLIVTMTRELRAQVVELCPAQVRRAFTLAELAAIVEAGVLPAPSSRDRAGLADQIARAAAHRVIATGRPGGIDIADPYGGPDSGYERSFREIQRCVEVLASAWR